MSTAATGLASQTENPLKRDPASFSCQYPGCPDFAKTGGSNLSLYARYGRKQVRLLICSSCGRTFSELKGTPLWDSRLDFKQVADIFTKLVAGNSIRGAARSERGNGKYGLSKNTVKRYLRLAMLYPVEVWALIRDQVDFDYQQYLDMLKLKATDVVERSKNSPTPPKLNATKELTVTQAAAFLNSLKDPAARPAAPRS